MSTGTVHPRGVRGFTILEMLLALAISSIVMASVPMLIALSARAAPRDSGVQAVATQASDLFAQLHADLQAATEITALTATSITMLAPSRDGSGATQKIAYAWGGTAGDPVTVRLDAGDPVVLVSSAQSFGLDAVKREGTAYTAFSLTETEASGWEEASRATRSEAIPPSGALVQVISPPTKAGSIGWRMSEMEVMLGCASPTAGVSVLVELRELNADFSLGTRCHCQVTVPTVSLKKSASKVILPVAGFAVPTDKTLGVVLRLTSTGAAVSTAVVVPGASFMVWVFYQLASDASPGMAVSGYVLCHRLSGWSIDASGGATARSPLVRLDVKLGAGDGPWEFATSIRPLSPVAMP